MTQPPGPDESTGPAQPPEPVPPADAGQPPAQSAPPPQEPPAIRPPAPAATGPGEFPQPGDPAGPGYPGQPGYPGYPGQAAPGGYPGLQPGVPPQYPAGGYDHSQPYPVQYDPSQPYVLYQATPTGGMFLGQVGDGDPLISPDYSGWWRRSLAIVKQGWKSLAVLQAIGFLVSLLFTVPQTLLVLSLTDDLTTASATVDPDTGAPVTPDLGPIFAGLGLSMLGAFLAVMVTFVVAIACNHVAVSVAAGLQPRLGAALSLAARRVFPLLGWQLLAGLIILVGICACILPAIYLSAVFVLLPAVVTFERGGSVISRCFRLFHGDLGASISRVATIAGIGIGVGVVGYVVNTIIQLLGGKPTLDPAAAGAFGGASTGYIVAVVVGSVVADMLGRAGSVLTAPLTLTAYADLRARIEPLSTATLANEARLAPAYPQGPGEGFPEPGQYAPGPGPDQSSAQHPGQGPAGSDSDWMPPNR